MVARLLLLALVIVAPGAATARAWTGAAVERDAAKSCVVDVPSFVPADGLDMVESTPPLDLDVEESEASLGLGFVSVPPSGVGRVATPPRFAAWHSAPPGIPPER